MYVIGSLLLVLIGYFFLVLEMKRRMWIMELCFVKVSMIGFKLGKVKFLVS